MSIKDILKLIETAEEKGSITIDKRIDLNEALIEAGDLVVSASERLGNVPDFIDEPESNLDLRLAYVEGVMGIEVNLTKERMIDQEGNFDHLEFTKDGLRMGGGGTVIIPISPQNLNGEVEISIDVSKVEGAWDRGDSYKVFAGKTEVYSEKNRTPKVGVKTVLFRHKGRINDFRIQVNNNNSGGGGSAESITIRSITIKTK